MSPPEYYGDHSRHLWIQQGVSIFESDWMATQRFMYLNDLSYARLKRHGTALASVLTQAEERFERSDRSFSASQQHSYLIRKAFDTATRRRWYGNRHDFGFDCLGGKRPVRYCPLCIRSCFHTKLFQFPVVANCPHHGVPLVNGCLSCGKPIATLASIPGLDHALFCCAACDAPFVSASKLTYRVLSGFLDAQVDFDEAHMIVANLCTIDVTNISTLCLRDSSGDDFARFYTHALFAVASTKGVRPEWLLGLQSKVARYPVALEWPPVHVVGGNEDDLRAQKTTLHQRLRELTRIIRSINRELSRLVQTVCGHCQQPSLLVQTKAIPFVGKEYALTMDAHDCPCCAVLTWWRAHFRSYFGFELHYINEKSPPLLADHGGWLGGLLPLEPNRLALAALALFAGLAAQMWEWLSPKKACTDVAWVMYKTVSARRALEDAGYRLSEEIERHKHGSNALDLPLPRHDFRVPQLHCIRGEECYRVTYSLDQGIEYMKCCQRLRQQGALWKCDYYWPKVATARKRQDRWYEGLAKECSLRVWNDMYRNQFQMNSASMVAARRAAAFEQPV